MRRALPNVLPWALMLLGSTGVFLALRWRAVWDFGWAWHSPAGHFWVVSAASAVCLLLGLAAGLAAIRSRNARVLLLSLSFLSMAGLFTVHGLATPGFLLGTPGGPAQVTVQSVQDQPSAAFAMEASYGGYGAYRDFMNNSGGTITGDGPVPPRSPFYNVTGLSSRLALAVSALFLAASAVRLPVQVEGWFVRWRHAVLGFAIVALATYGLAGITAPWLVPTALTGNDAFSWGTLAGVTGLGGFAAIRFGTGYYRSGLQMYGAVALGAILLVQAQFSMHFGQTWTGTFWLYHVQLLGGFLAIGWGVLLEYSQGRTVRSFEALAVSDVLEQLRTGYTESIVSLSAALEARDGYTLGHGERVAALAVLIAQEVGFTGRRLRGVAAGALLHDVGKIAVPDAVLHKPGGLTTQEYGVVQEHPSRGAEMLRHAFDSRVECNVIRHHHERWDGKGYPDGLAGTDIPLEARITAVADVYDALRSHRAYRPAWSREDAMAHMLSESGTHFDPRCMAAFVRVVDQWEDRYTPDVEAYEERRAA